MYVMFDFDGTLVDSFACVLENFNKLALDFNFRQINLAEIDELRNLSSRELVQHLKIPLYKIPRVLAEARKSLQHAMHHLRPFTGIAKMLADLAQAGFSLGIVTSNAKENVTSWLAHHGIAHYFEFIHVESNYFGKKRILKKIMRAKKIVQAFYVGDETRDIEAANQCNLSSIAVTWGFNSEKILAVYSPRYIARMPGEIVGIVQGI